MKRRTIKELTTLIAITTASINLKAIPNLSFEVSASNEVVINHLSNISDEDAATLIAALYKANKINIDSETGAIFVDANVVDVLNAQGRVNELSASAEIKQNIEGRAV